MLGGNLLLYHLCCNWSTEQKRTLLHLQNSVMSCFSLCRMMLAPLLHPVHEVPPSSSKIHQVLNQTTSVVVVFLIESFPPLPDSGFIILLLNATKRKILKYLVVLMLINLILKCCFKNRTQQEIVILYTSQPRQCQYSQFS